ncbi:hypothetical protein AAJ76_400027493 [Vairimorpha ceranae]|uniref:Uncharacterized protein n=1 Tax=Vairimorpha ceranae TaxID=40302 RepID=A0A0F9WG26_9MICR|nr:hypothetical protein AAJ76_400027493 [Vairimorpha ceranae]KKO76311.1 hypothetical protein AAJ76_400027493 [Vairimorpha ceranae]
MFYELPEKVKNGYFLKGLPFNNTAQCLYKFKIDFFTILKIFMQVFEILVKIFFQIIR